MIDPTNPFARYVAGLRTALGDRDPMTALREAPALLRQATTGLDTRRLTTPEKPGKWSVIEVVQHLADSELVGGFRFRMILAHERPPIPAYDEDLWCHRLRYVESDLATALDDFDQLRRSNLRLLDRSTPEDLARAGVHSERGDESIAWMVTNYAGHDHVHLNQIARILKAIG